MNIITLKLEDLAIPERNVRIHTEKQLREYERSVRMFGQIRPIVVDENNTILAGRGLYDTLKRMGRETAECYRYTNLTENQKKKLMIADNKIFSLGIENLDTLNQFLEELQGDLEIPGFDDEVLRQMVASADEITETLSEYGTLNDEEIQKIQKNSEKRGETAQVEYPIASIIKNPTDATMDTDRPGNVADSETATDIRKYTICPACGTKVWL